MFDWNRWSLRRKNRDYARLNLHHNPNDKYSLKWLKVTYKLQPFPNQDFFLEYQGSSYLICAFLFCWQLAQFA